MKCVIWQPRRPRCLHQMNRVRPRDGMHRLRLNRLEEFATELADLIREIHTAGLQKHLKFMQAGSDLNDEGDDNLWTRPPRHRLANLTR